MDIQPRYEEPGALTRHTKFAAIEMGVKLPQGLALLFWNHNGTCRAFSLMQNNLHLRVGSLDQIYENRSEIIPV
jgi:hypothetical protein